MNRYRFRPKHSEKTKRKISESNKGKKRSLESRIKMSENKNGKKLSEKHKENISKALKGKMPKYIPSNKGNKGRYKMSKEARNKKSEAKKGERNHKWKKEGYGYRAIHYWVKRYKGEPLICEKCGKEKTTPKSIHWANIDHKYRRILDDYIALCVKCHKEYDKKNSIKI